ncbi:MAG: hypothetical protein LBS54_09695 [Dysgonamonadaceae bacterium]|jgi:hypothetical protein|nr:hypothetical protein [Dysgonamonadaceae bacterium]
MSNINYLPGTYKALASWLINFVDRLATLLGILGITEGQFTAIREVISDFQVANQKAESSTATSADRLVRKEKAAAAKKAVRQFVNEHLRFNGAMTDEYRRILGLTVPDPEPTPAPPPETAPAGTVDYSKRQQHTLRVKDSHSSGRAKPEHVRGFEVWHKLGDEPKSDDEYQYVGFSSNDHLVVNYPLSMVGTVVHYRLRWKSTRNEPGPWSETVTAIIN